MKNIEHILQTLWLMFKAYFILVSGYIIISALAYFLFCGFLFECPYGLHKFMRNMLFLYLLINPLVLYLILFNNYFRPEMTGPEDSNLFYAYHANTVALFVIFMFASLNMGTYQNLFLTDVVSVGESVMFSIGFLLTQNGWPIARLFTTHNCS